MEKRQVNASAVGEDTYFEVFGKLDDFLERKKRVFKGTFESLQFWDMEP